MWRVGGPVGKLALESAGNVGVTPYAVPATSPNRRRLLEIPACSTRATHGSTRLWRTRTLKPVAPTPLWLQHTVSSSAGGRSEVRWYQFRPDRCSGGTCTASALRQQGTITHPTDFVFNGAISPADSGTQAVIDYNVGSRTRRAEIRAQSRNATTPLGQMTGEIVLDTSAASNQDFTCFDLVAGVPAVCRWGDYAGAGPDPNNRTVVLGLQHHPGTGSHRRRPDRRALENPQLCYRARREHPNGLLYGVAKSCFHRRQRDV